MTQANVREMIRVYRTRGLAYRLAVRTFRVLRELNFEGRLIARKRRGDDIFDPGIRLAAAREALRNTKLPVLKEEEHLADVLVEQEIVRLATKGKP